MKYLRTFTGIFIGVILSLNCYCQDINSLRSQREKSLAEIARTEELLKQTQANRQNELQNLQLINRKITVRNKIVTGISNEISMLDQEIRKNESTIGSLDTEIQVLKGIMPM